MGAGKILYKRVGIMELEANVKEVLGGLRRARRGEWCITPFSGNGKVDMLIIVKYTFRVDPPGDNSFHSLFAI